VRLEDAYAACARLARSHYENFPVASRLLPARMRPHVAAVYAYARLADDIADEGDVDAARRHARLDEWTSRLHASVAGTTFDAGASTLDTATRDLAPAVFTATAHTIRSIDLPIDLFDDLVSAFRQDITVKSYDSWSSLLDYCRRSANPVGRLVLRIGGWRSADLDAASDAVCTALQLTNFWQDLAVDWRRGRLYVPTEERQRAGASLDALDRGELTDQWRLALSQSSVRTRELFDRGRAVCDGVSGRLRYELRATWLGGLRVLDRSKRLASTCSTRGRRSGCATCRRSRGARSGGGDEPPDLVLLRVPLVVAAAARRDRRRVGLLSCRGRHGGRGRVRDRRGSGIRGQGSGTGRDVVRAQRQAWRDELNACYEGQATTPQGRALQPWIERYQLTRQPFLDLIDGVGMDLDRSRYATFDELYEYCWRVASTVGFMCLEIFGVRDAGRDYALNLGLALQLTNILRDVKADYECGHIYLPLQDLDRFGCDEAELGAETMSAGLRELLQSRPRARDFYARAAASRPTDSPAGSWRPRSWARFIATCSSIEARDYDILSARVRVTRPRQASIALSTWFRMQLGLDVPA
jgi:phytoene synthase